MSDIIERAEELDRILPPDWTTDAATGARWNIQAADGTEICLVQQQTPTRGGPDAKRDTITAGIVEMRTVLPLLTARLRSVREYADKLNAVTPYCQADLAAISERLRELIEGK